MKYGYVKDNLLLNLGETDDNGTWWGKIEYNENHERLTAAEMIAKYSLKLIVTPSTFNGNYADYNFVEQDGKFILADLKAEKKLELAEKEIEELRTLRVKECYSIINRGGCWYDLLTDEQKIELKEWYNAWLNATDKKDNGLYEIPTKPLWLEEMTK